jgi:exodeoxyribonuclease III
LKIATFNINNIYKRLHNLTAWLARAQPDVVCLQELKVEQRAFPASALRDLGYRGVWLGERSWNGVAILARDCDPVPTRSGLPGNPQDRQARYIEAAVNGVLITSIYLPTRKSSTRSEVRLQIGLVRTFNRARRGTHEGRRASRLGRRLQRRTDCAGHLSNAISR